MGSLDNDEKKHRLPDKHEFMFEPGQLDFKRKSISKQEHLEASLFRSDKPTFDQSAYERDEAK